MLTYRAFPEANLKTYFVTVPYAFAALQLVAAVVPVRAVQDVGT